MPTPSPLYKTEKSDTGNGFIEEMKIGPVVEEDTVEYEIEKSASYQISPMIKKEGRNSINPKSNAILGAFTKNIKELD